MKKGMIIAAFAGVGKTWVGKNYNNVLDLESTYYKWDSTGLEHLSEEERKGLPNRKPNPKWPQNYIDEVLKQKDNYDIVLIILPHEILKTEEISEYFFNNGIEFYIALPEKTSITTILQRLKERGNNEHFIREVERNFPFFIEEFSKDKYKKIIMKDGEYLGDTLIRVGLLNRK